MPEPGLRDLYLRDDVAGLFADAPLTRAFALEGEVVRSVAGRETLRLQLQTGVYYLKRHRGVGLAEVLKNLLVGKMPVLGARNEFETCRLLEAQGLPAPRVAAFAESTGAPQSRCSFVLCDALLGYEDLEVRTLPWLTAAPSSREIRDLVTRIALCARDLHEAGVAHRDFYLCHLLAHEDPGQRRLAVLDLHRARIFSTLPESWRRKDLAALLYSSLDLPVDRRSWLRFVRLYSGKPLKVAFREDGAFWQAVYDRACELYEKGTRKGLTAGRFKG
ncbi:MAG: lipopolysaccharide core heptose(I) kinase RfaP [Pseudomonadota bacterium]